MGDLIERLQLASTKLGALFGHMLDILGRDGVREIGLDPDSDSDVFKEAADELARLRAEVEGLRRIDSAEIYAHWYCVDTCGSAELCMDKDQAERSAKIADESDPHNAPHHALQLVDAALLKRVIAAERAADKGWSNSIQIANGYAERAGIAERERDELRRRIAEAERFDAAMLLALGIPVSQDDAFAAFALVRLDAEEAK